MEQATHYRAPDCTDLDAMDLPDEVRERIQQARIEAATIQADLTPEHIFSWPELLGRLEHAVRRARANAALLGGVDVKEFDRRRSEPRMRRFLRRIFRS
ncbi:MAG: hypothetical protein Q8P12_03390 [bacterium]|jgi:hypothetical protein|nr:hypothetical protein [bacterium]